MAKFLKVTGIALIIIMTLMFTVGCREKLGDNLELDKPPFNIYPTAEFLADNTIKNSIDGLDELETDIEKALYLWKRACDNQEYLDYYTFFIDAGGSTDISRLSGSLASQSFRMVYDDYYFHQHINFITSANFKGQGDNNTLRKLASGILDRASQTVRVGNNEYKRSGGDWLFNQEKSLLSASWGEVEEGTYTPGEESTNPYYTETDIDYYFPDIVYEATIETLVDSVSGKSYYRVVMTIDVDVANSDDDYDDENSMMGKLKSSTGAEKDVHYGEYILTFEVWDVGLLKMWSSKENWIGTLKAGFLSFNGDTKSESPKYYNYDKAQAMRVFDLIEIYEEAMGKSIR